MGTQRLIADRYSLVEPLPGSATGIGWRAQDLWSGQLVAITRVPVSGLVGDELLRARHEIGGEVRALGGVQHDRLTRAMDVVLDADDLWVASELLPGVTMADELARRGVVGPEDAARWGRDVADGLVAAHGAGVSHRNLHAGMVGIAADGRAVVGGFATTVVTPEGLRNGTPVHVAPEVARGAKPSAASDVFALGAMLYLAVEGRGPFLATANRDQLLAAVAFAVAAPLRAGRLSGPLMRMLHPDPAQRPPAVAVADQFRQLAAVPGDGGSMITRLEPGPPAGVPAPPGPASVGPPPYRAPLPWVAPPPGPGMPQPPGPWLPPTVTDPSAGQRKRVWWVVAAAVVAVLWLAGSLLIVFGPPWMWGLPGRPTAAPAPPPPIGDPRTADPCSLLSVDSVQRFGQLTISREAARTGRCGRTVVLGDRSRVYVTAWAFRGAAADLCAVADAGTQTAVSALSSGSLPQPSCPPPRTPRGSPVSQPKRLPASGVQLLPAGTGSLARGLPPVPAGTLFALGDRGGICVAPTARLTVIFGRNEPEVHVCVGAGDRGVSRQHGLLRHDGRRWTVRNTGHLPIRLPGSQLLLSGHQEPLPVAYTPLFIRSGRGREHLLEVRVAGPAPADSSGVQFDDTTHHTGTIWELSDRERLVLVALGQRYLRHEAYPQPLSWSNVAVELAELQPGAGWTPKSAEHVVAAVRARLAGRGLAGLTRDEVGEPVGNALNHNLILELLLSTTLVPPDLRLLD